MGCLLKSTWGHKAVAEEGRGKTGGNTRAETGREKQRGRGPGHTGH